MALSVQDQDQDVKRDASAEDGSLAASGRGDQVCRSSPERRTSWPWTSARFATGPVTSRSIPDTATRGRARARSRSSTASGHPALPRLSHRGAGREKHVRRDGLALDLRRAAHRRRSLPGFRELLTEQELLARGHEVPLRGFPAHGHPDGHALGDDQRLRLLSPRAARDRLDEDQLLTAAAILMSKVRTIAAFSLQDVHRPAD